LFRFWENRIPQANRLGDGRSWVLDRLVSGWLQSSNATKSQIAFQILHLIGKQVSLLNRANPKSKIQNPKSVLARQLAMTDS
jgi:hypothetical protein